jgi:hypothetical protein
MLIKFLITLNSLPKDPTLSHGWAFQTSLLSLPLTKESILTNLNAIVILMTNSILSTVKNKTKVILISYLN